MSENRKDEGAVTLFELSRADEDYEETRAFLAAGGDPNEPTPGRTRLHVAATEGYVRSVVALLDAGADPNAPSDDGNTPLHELALNLNRRGAWEDSGSGVWRVRRIVAELLRAGADPLARNADGDMPMHSAVRKMAVAEEHGGVQRAVVRELLLAQVRPGALSYDGATPLILAIKSRFAKPVELFLRAQADPNLADTDGWFPLHHAAHCGWYRLVADLIRYGADPNQTTPTADGARTPLHVILDRSEEVTAGMPQERYDAYLKTVGVLVQNGDVGIHDAQGRTAMDRSEQAPERVCNTLVALVRAYAEEPGAPTAPEPPAEAPSP